MIKIITFIIIIFLLWVIYKTLKMDNDGEGEELTTPGSKASTDALIKYFNKKIIEIKADATLGASEADKKLKHYNNELVKLKKVEERFNK
jgi:hypothetical protein